MKFSELSYIFKQISQESSRLIITDLLADLLRQVTPQEVQIISYLSLGHLRAVYQSTQFNLGKKGLITVVQKLLNISFEEIKKRLSTVGDIGVLVEQNYSSEKGAPTKRVSTNFNSSSVNPVGFNSSNFNSNNHDYVDREDAIGANLTIQQVYDRLIIIEQIAGTRSQDIKSEALLILLQEVDPASASIIINIILGTLRLGFYDMTLLDAFSVMVVGNKSLRKEIEHAYNVRADIGLIGLILKEEGAKSLRAMQPIIGIPIRPASAERATSAQAIIKKIGPCVAQPKLDGFRLQIHFKKVTGRAELYFFSRNLHDMSSMFPDLVTAFIGCAHNQVILEGEAIGYDESTGAFLPFQQTVKRKRKHDIEQAAHDMPLHLYLFDVLDIDGKNSMPLPHYERHALLVSMFGKCDNTNSINNLNNTNNINKNIIHVIEEKFCEDAQTLQDYFDKQISEGLEGLVVKKPDAPYTPGKRNSNWIKLKRGQEGELIDTLDVVILGYNYGQGRRARFGIGAFLVGIYNSNLDQFQSIAKVGTGLSDKGWHELKEKCEHLKIVEMPHNVQVSQELYPDVWVKPEIVVEVSADEITQSPLHKAGATKLDKSRDKNSNEGLALRFPRFVRYRPDKSAEQATTAQEVKELYALQYYNTVK